MWLLYQFLLILVLLLAGPFLFLSRRRHYGASWRSRLFGDASCSTDRPLWIHAVSVGEVGVAATLVRSLPADTPLVVTTITPTGQSRALAELGDRARVTYLPIDLDFAIEGFLLRHNPRALVLIEGDLWPLLLKRVKDRSMPVTVVNGRVGDRSFRRMRWLRPLLSPLLGRVDLFAMQTDGDVERLVTLGVEERRLVKTGNLKFETVDSLPNSRLETEIRSIAGERAILIAGSTMPGEEDLVLEAFQAIGGGERALLIVAPRHPERWNSISALLAESEFDFLRRTDLPAATPPAVLLLDSLGELSSLYSLSHSTFIGGTLVPTGGHNPLEPARFAVPIAIGPSMDNFRRIAELFDQDEAWQRVHSANDLAAAWDEWLREPERGIEVGSRGKDLIHRNRGALENTLEALGPTLALFGEGV